MEKTILGLNRQVSIIILSGVCMFFTFVSGYSNITNIVAFLLISIKSIIFIAVPFLFYILEKKELEFKKIAGIYMAYFIINFFSTILVSIVTIGIFKLIFDLVNLIILISCLAIFIEYILSYSGNDNKIYNNTVMRIVYLVGNFISYPFINFINKKSGK